MTEGGEMAPENPWIRHARRVAYENDWMTVFHDDVTRPDGAPGIYGVVHVRSRAVGVVALDTEDRVLLVGQFRYTLGQYSWEIPAGGSSGDESPVATAARELQEETGYRAGSIRPLLRVYLSNSITDEEAYCFLATDLEPGEHEPEGTEQLTMRWVPFWEAVRLVSDGSLTDALTVLGLQQTALVRLGRDALDGPPSATS